MLDIKLIQRIEDISIELRNILGLPIALNNFNEFHQITFGELSKKIMDEFTEIAIVDNIDLDYSYMKKLKEIQKIDDRNIQYIIYIGTEMSAEVRIDSLMHEMAHFVLHAENLEPSESIGRYKGSPVQENEANCLSRAFLIPRTFFVRALTMFSRNDGSVKIDEMANYFCVQESLVIERGRDLRIWN